MEGTEFAKAGTENTQPQSAALIDFPHVFSEVQKLWGQRNTQEDNHLDRVSTVDFVHSKELESSITKQTQLGLMKDSDQYAPTKNADGSTTYTVVQLGLTNRPLDNASKQTIGAFPNAVVADKDSSTNAASAEKSSSKESDFYYSRKIDITVPAGALNLGESQFNYDERKSISEKEFNNILANESKTIANLEGVAKSASNRDVELYSHGVFTDANLADTQAALLGLTTGHPSVTVDWAAYPNSKSNPNRPYLSLETYLHYMEDRSSAISSDAQLAPALDKTIATIGADHTIMVGFSHGGMFDARYLRHRADSGLPKIETLLLAHPDLPIKAPEIHLTPDKSLSLFDSAAAHTFVVGGQSDKQLSTAAITPFADGLRVGNDAPETRELLHKAHATPITEVDRSDSSSDQHILNFAGISSILNGTSGRSEQQVQQDFIQATQAGRKHR